ncbi:MAG: NAD(+) diphosphatase [Thermoflexales bacterium]|nr:NAD(+) diphosphatase [Thermoflexales bacterium]MDW8352403.1 NAD(+) diphosphatase [Anaerolineae bacterium]
MPAPHFKRAYPTNRPLPETGLWFAVNQHGVIVAMNGDEARLPSGASHLPGMARPDNAILLGEIDAVACLACTVPDDIALPEGYRAIGLRDLYGRIDDHLHAIAGYATQMLHWQRTSNYCANCGAPLTPIPEEWGKRCLRCGFTAYPPVNPCTITLVYDGDRVLMTHKPGWGARYGLVAGFVEPGETLEQSVEREVMEETGIEVCDVCYWRSQPWPFPHQLMCGFYARYAGGELRVDHNELDDARWFTKDEIRSGRPTLPPPLSIARRLIEHWLAQPLRSR